ncbi:hypothetical protein C7S20_16165 [Christiangramia fulva]|uniref:Uncharacterized protein n=2 Tax=Christiangramia fulva TaxID=2126553 RepID=A0A2R3Z8R1_9FLAO|nr:hypothetical protein C7S20_16165 [Christiangramia fulva]
MSFESTGGNVVQRKSDFRSQSNYNTSRHKSSVSEGWVFRRSRLTDDDLELFRQNILREHKKKHYRVLATTAILFLLIGILLYFLLS